MLIGREESLLVAVVAYLMLDAEAVGMSCLSAWKPEAVVVDDFASGFSRKLCVATCFAVGD